MTGRQLIAALRDSLAPHYGAREAEAIARLVAEERYGLGRSRLIADPDAEVDTPGFDQLLSELVAMRPVQYVLGSADFCGLRIGVREGVLIPRPETAGLVEAAVSRLGTEAPLRLLDAGTGSGAIAIALASRMPRAEVVAVDISDEALAIARDNGRRLGMRVEWRRADILSPAFAVELGMFDAILSNPPYIPAGEREAMHPNVTRYEPAGALFVPDDDPLIFYRRLAEAGRAMLRSGGGLFFEIHERFADEVLQLLRAAGYVGTELLHDIFDKPRIVLCRKE